MAGFNFNIALQIMLFLFAMWFAGRAFQRIGLPPILGLIGVGLLFGKNVLDFVPYASNGMCDSVANPQITTDAHASAGRMLAAKSAACDTFEWNRFVGEYITSIWTFIGNAGVLLMIMESGMHVHFDKMKIVGKKATIIAIIGTGLPILAGYLVTGALFTDSDPELAWFPYGFAAGCSFAPTSVAISIKLLGESKMLNSIAGQTTIAAAFIDDVFSIVTLVILEQVAKGSTSATSILVPMICCFSFLGLSVLLAIYVFPHITKALAKIPLAKNVSIQPRDEVQLFLMFATLTFFGWVSSISEINGVAFIGSPLLGAFAAGMAWVNVSRSHAIWQAQLKRIVKWAMRIFFTCTVGFAIPVRVMFTGDALWRGLILGFGPCIATKLISGLFAWSPHKDEASRELARTAHCCTRWLQPTQLLVGFAMVARGEFAYLVAEIARSLQYKGGEYDPTKEPVYMLSEQAYAAVVWALVMATIIAPFGFKFALKIFDKATPQVRSDFIGGSLEKYARSAFMIRIAGRYSPGLQRELLSTLHNEGVDVLDAQITSVRADDTPDADIELFYDSFTVLSRGKKKDFDTEKLEEIHHALSEVLNDADGQIIFEPADEDFSRDGIIEVQILHAADQKSSVLHEITDKMSSMGLDVVHGMVHQSLQPGHHASPEKSKSKKDLANVSPTPATTAELASIRVEAVSEMKPASPLRAPSLKQAGRSFTTVLSNVGKKSKAKADGKDDHSSQGTGVAREVFYARESDGSRLTSSKRRHEIQHALQTILKEHNLHGEVLVRLVHEQGTIGGQTRAPRFKDQEAISVVKCSGRHHKDMLHAVCDVIEAQKYDVIHADITPSSTGFDKNTFYIRHKEKAGNLTFSERDALCKAIQGLYTDGRYSNSDGLYVTVTGLAESAPTSPTLGASDGDNGVSSLTDTLARASALLNRPRSPRASKEAMVVDDGTPYAAQQNFLDKAERSASRSASRASKEFMGERARRASKEFMDERNERQVSFNN